MNTPTDILFTPLKIGPVETKNRFFQTSHGNGNGYRDPQSMIGMRGTKAAGGWGVVATEQVEIHRTSDMSPSWN